jgi:hypothetical protein
LISLTELETKLSVANNRIPENGIILHTKLVSITLRVKSEDLRPAQEEQCLAER